MTIMYRVYSQQKEKIQDWNERPRNISDERYEFGAADVGLPLFLYIST
jgi:hypothetical protein